MTSIKLIGTGGVWSGSPGNANVEMDMDDVLFFDGSDDKIDTNLNLNSTNSSGNTTIMCWFKAHSSKSAADQKILSGYKGSDGGRWDLIHRDDNTVRFQHHDKGDGAQYLLDTGPCYPDKWHHVAIVHDTTLNTTTLYWNGESFASQGSVTNDLTPDEDLFIGCTATSGSHFHGYIADVMIYDAVLNATQVAIASSRIGIHKDTIGAGTPDGHYPLINNATSNQGGGGGTPSVTGTARTYGQFAIEVIPSSDETRDIGTNTNDGSFTASVTDVTLTVQDGTKFHTGQIIQIGSEKMYVSGISSNDLTVRRGIDQTTIASHSTGTDIYNASAFYVNGNFNVTSGKLEALTASCLDLDGSDELIKFATVPQAQLRLSHSWSAWIRLDDGDPTANNTIVGAFNGGNDRVLFYVGTDSKLTYLYQANGTSEYAQAESATFVDNANPWAHVVATMSYTDSSNAVMKLYVNGKEIALSSDSAKNGTFSGNMGGFTMDDAYPLYIGAENNAGTAQWFLDGKIRDVRMYEVALTPDQVDTVYSGKTPNPGIHRWTIGGTTEDIFSHGMTTSRMCVSDTGYLVTAALGSDLAADKDLVSAYTTNFTKLGGPSGYFQNSSSWSGYRNETGFTTTRGEVYVQTSDFTNLDGSHSSGPKQGIMTTAVGSSRGTTQNVDTSADGFKRMFALLTHATQGTSYGTMESQGTYRSKFENVSVKRVSVGSELVGLSETTSELADLIYENLEFANGLWIGTNGTVSASNGNMDIYQLDVSGNYTMKNIGTFIPNWGNVTLSLPNNQSYSEEQYIGDQSDGDDAIEFYNLTTNQGWNRFYFQSITVRNVLNLGGYRNWLIGTTVNRAAGNKMTLTMGYDDARFVGSSDTSAGLRTGGYITGGGGFSIGGTGGPTGNSTVIQGASELYQCPVHNTNSNLNNHLWMQNSDVNAGYQPSGGNPVELANLSFQHDWTSVTEAVAHEDASCDTNHTSNQTTVTCDATTSIKVGHTVTGTGIPRDTVVTAVNNATVTSFTISQAATATNTNTTLKFHDIASYKITGPCSFKAITMQQGAHLDLNGQRIYVDGDFTISSTGRGSSFDADGEVYTTGSHAIGSLAHELTNNLSSHTVVHVNSSSKNQNTSLGGSYTLGRVVVNGGSTVRHSGDRDYGTTPLFVLSGTYDPDADATWGNIQAATSSTLDLDADTVTVKGNLVLSGGVLGDSAIDGTQGTVPHDKGTGSNSTKYHNSGDKTLEGWFKVDNGSAPSNVSTIGLISKDNYGHGMHMLADGTVRAGSTAGDSRYAVGNTAINDGKWHHIAMTHDVSEDTGIKIYVDGKLDGQSTASNPSGSDSGGNVPVEVGGSSYLHYDEIRIWEDVRTESEIRANMWTEIANDAAGLLGVYHCNDGSGSTFTDSAASGAENGTLGSASWVGAGGVSFTASNNSGTATAVIDFAASGSLKYKSGDLLPGLDISSGTVALSCVDTAQASSEITFDSVKITGGTFQGGAGKIKVRAETTGGFAWQHTSGTYTHQNGTVEFTHNTDSHIQENTFYNLIINGDSSGTATHWRPKSGSTLTVGNILQLKEGRFNVDNADDTLTVTSHMQVESGTTFNYDDDAAGAHNFKSLTIDSGGLFKATQGVTTLTGNNGSGYIMQASGNSRFEHNNGTVTFDGTESLPSIDVNDSFYNVIIDTNNKLRVIDQTFDIANDLTITSGGAFAHDSYPNTAIEVGGNVDIQGGTLGSTGCTANWQFNSLTIGNGATYIAPSGTTEITGEGDGTSGTNGYAWYNVTGTFTHNNGTVSFTGNSDSDIRDDTFYNVIINGDTSSVDYYIRQKDGDSSSSAHIRILNNLDIQRGGFSRAKSANELSVFGILDICSGGSGAYFGDTSDTGIYNLGTVNIHNNGTFNLSNGANNVNSIRNIAGTVARD